MDLTNLILRFEMLFSGLDLYQSRDLPASAVKHCVVKGAADNYSRKDIDKMTEVASSMGAKGLAWVKVVDGEVQLAKFLTSIQGDTWR